jgi:hypothetical protein
MAEARIRIRSREFQPAAVGTDETKALFTVKAGERVLWASLMILTRSQEGVATSTYKVGDTDDDGFIAATNTDQAVGTIVGGAGDLLATSGGKLYTADDTVDMTYTKATAGNVKPKCRVTIATVREWPN